jgi:G:T-mismatch repair DNA endonuclease (very short patch repair protein)
VIAEDGHRMDGYVEYGGVIFLFQLYGCYWHGCSQCNDPTAEHPHFYVPHSRVREATERKGVGLCDAYKRLGRKWQLHTVWEHEYKPSLRLQGMIFT